MPSIKIHNASLSFGMQFDSTFVEERYLINFFMLN